MIELIKCSSCNYSYDNILTSLNTQFTLNLSKLIITKINFSLMFRIIHETNNISHFLCLNCEKFWINLTNFRDTNNFTCPHDNCKFMVITHF